MKFIPYKRFRDPQNDVDTFGLMIIYLKNASQSGGVDLDAMIVRRDLRLKIEALVPKDGAEPPAGVVLDKDEYALINGMPRFKWPWGDNDAVIEILQDIRDARAPDVVKAVESKAA